MTLNPKLGSKSRPQNLDYLRDYRCLSLYSACWELLNTEVTGKCDRSCLSSALLAQNPMQLSLNYLTIYLLAHFIKMTICCLRVSPIWEKPLTVSLESTFPHQLTFSLLGFSKAGSFHVYMWSCMLSWGEGGLYTNFPCLCQQNQSPRAQEGWKLIVTNDRTPSLLSQLLAPCWSSL